MNAFLFPYRSRIMIALKDGPAIELYRTRAQMSEREFRKQTADIDPAWEAWIEEQTDRRTLISDRPGALVPSHNRGKPKNSKALTAAEVETLEASGTTEYQP